MTKFSALGIMMSSQLRNEIRAGRQRDHGYVSYPHCVADIHRGVLFWIWNPGLAVAKTARAVHDVRAL
jgi:hypothetical protein